MNRRLYRCRENRVIAGVASGVAEYLGLDPTLVRVLWFLSIFFGGVTLVIYIGLALIVPLEPLSAEAIAAAPQTDAAGHAHGPRGNGNWTTIFGIALMLLGGLALVGVLLPDVHAWKYLWPLFLVGMGAVLVVGALRRGGQLPPTASPPAANPPTATPSQEPTNS